MYQYTVGTSEPSDLKYTVKYSYSNEKWADVLTGVERIFPQNSVNAISLEQEETPEIVTRLLGENAQRYDMKSRLLPNSGISVANVSGNYSKVESDEIGNITSYDGFNYTWVGRQLKSVSQVGNPSVGATYSYNSDGQRIGKNITLDDGETYDYDYYYNGDILAGYKLVITKSDGSSTTHNVAFMYDENGEAFGFNYNGNDYYYVRNAQNDVIFISNSDNIGVVMYQYDAWGNMTACYDTSDDGMLSIVNPYAYRGYFYEFETNTYFLKSRYYNPELCRFISADDSDTLFYTPDDVTDKNLFAYCDNNPVVRADSDGDVWHIIAGAVVGATINASCAAMSTFSETGKVNIGAIAVSALSGAITGALSVSCVSRFAMIAVSGVMAFVESAVTQKITNNSVNIGDALLDGAIGAATGAIGGAGKGSKNLTNLGKQSIKRTSRAFSKKGIKTGIKEGVKAARYYGKCSKSFYKPFIKGIGKDIGISLATTFATSKSSRGFFSRLFGR